MPKSLMCIKLFLEFIRCFPHLVIFYLHKNKSILHTDTLRWMKIMGLKYKLPIAFLYLLSFHHEFRNLFYYRIGVLKYFLNIICPKMATLYIYSEDIGEGLFIRHGFATAIGAKSIGKNCHINQQVTIGDYQDECPVILDNVTIKSGAIIIGKVTIGNNVVVGANATVFTDIPDNCTVYPTSNVMKWRRSYPHEDDSFNEINDSINKKN